MIIGANPAGRALAPGQGLICGVHQRRKPVGAPPVPPPAAQGGALDFTDPNNSALIL